MRKAGWSNVQIIAGLLALGLMTDASPQAYPTKPVHLVVGYTPGGAVDFTARLVGQKLSELLGQPIIVENRPGSATAIATERVLTSPPAGYTLLLIPISTAVLSAIRKDLPYNLERDLAPVSLVSTGPFLLLVHPSVPARNVKEFIALARSQPGKLNYGSPGVGTANHLAGELFAMMAKVKMVHVPYKGASDAVVATASGQLAASFPSVAGTLPLLATGKLKALAVTSAKRVPSLPLVPTLDEAALPGYDYFAWYGVGAPARAPKDIVAKLNSAIGKAVQTADMKEALGKQGFEAQAETPEQFGALIHREIERTSKLIAATGIKIE